MPSVSISVIMPVYNGMPLLRDALGCLASQGMDGEEWEVLAADDGSTDGSRELLEETAASGAIPLRVMDGARSGNWVASTNKMLGVARGEFISFLHQDDLYAPNRLRTMLAAARAKNGAPFFANDTFFVTADGRKRGLWRPPLPHGDVPPALCLEMLLVQNNLSVPGVFFRRGALGDVGLMDESLRYTADWDYWLRFASRYGIHHVAEALSGFRIHAGSQTVAIASRQDEMRRNLETVVARFMPEAERLLAPRAARRCARLARLGIETNLLLAAKAARAPVQWRRYWASEARCLPFDIFRFLPRSRLCERVVPRIMAGISSSAPRE